MYLGHHLATAFYMTSTRITGAGHQSAMVCMFLGELTNPLHNGYYIALEATKLEDLFNGRTTQQLTAIVELAFAASYILVRLFVAPVVLLHMTVVLWWRRSPKNPVWLVLLWTILIWGVLVGSIPWIEDCWKSIVKFLPQEYAEALPNPLLVAGAAGGSGSSQEL